MMMIMTPRDAWSFEVLSIITNNFYDGHVTTLLNISRSMEIFFILDFAFIELGFSTFSNIEKKFIIYELWKNGLEMDFATIECGLRAWTLMRELAK